MKVYQVGGSVRDELMGLAPRDLDYVVVGSTVEEMKSLGYDQVGKSFPVFMHPQTKCEYALARREKKEGKGYQGFTCETENVTLEEDLYRRDLTINAMAKDESGAVVDPFGGQDDLSKKVLRHVSIHFAEDPLRVLRVARFQARYSDFSVHELTKELMKVLVENELSELTKERFAKEFEKALTEKKPSLFFKLLSEVGFFTHYLPEWSYLDSMRMIDQEASVEAKLIAILQDQKHPKAIEVLKSKLGFNSSLLKEMQSLYGSLRKTPVTAEYVVSLAIRTKAHQKTELYSKLKEVLTLRGEDTSIIEEVFKVSNLFTRMDFSFVTELDVKLRTQAVKDKLLSEYLALKD